MKRIGDSLSIFFLHAHFLKSILKLIYLFCKSYISLKLSSCIGLAPCKHDFVSRQNCCNIQSDWKWPVLAIFCAQYESDGPRFAVWVWHHMCQFTWKKIQYRSSAHSHATSHICVHLSFLTQKYASAITSFDAAWYLSPQKPGRATICLPRRTDWTLVHMESAACMPYWIGPVRADSEPDWQAVMAETGV